MNNGELKWENKWKKKVEGDIQIRYKIITKSFRRQTILDTV